MQKELDKTKTLAAGSWPYSERVLPYKIRGIASQLIALKLELTYQLLRLS